MKKFIPSMQTLSDEFHIHILKFLEPLRADKDVEFIINSLLKYNMTTHQRVFIIADDGEAQFLPKTFVETEIASFFNNDDFTPLLQEARTLNYSNGLKLQPEYDYQFINNLRLITTTKKNLWKSETKHLYENLTFLRQLASREHSEAGNIYQEYLVFACKDLISKLFKDEILEEDQFVKLLELTQIIKSDELYHHLEDGIKIVTFLYYFRHYPSTCHPTIHPSLKQNMSAIIELLFQNIEENKIHFVPTFMRLLTFNLQYNESEHVINLCEKANQCYSRFDNIPQDDLIAVQKEFSEAWSKFSALSHLDVCLAIYKCRPIDKSNPTHPTILPSTLDTLIPHYASATEAKDKATIDACDEILSIAVQRIPIVSLEDPLNPYSMKRIFKHLQLADQKGYEKLKNSCVKRILAGMTVYEGVAFISGLVSKEELAVFIKSLQTYCGPQADETKYALKTEGLALLKFAKIQKEKGNNNYFDSCVNYLRSKSQYRIAAEAYTGVAQEETELYHLCSAEL
jgi:hypothetical protein